MSFSSSSNSASVPGLSLKKFVTQDEVDETKRIRQEEWEKVRAPEDPVACPEEPVDNRCLYDKLEAQRVQKQEERDEQFAFKNQVKRLDDDEVEFLDFVSERQQELSREKRKEEAELLSELKNAQVSVIKLAESKAEEKKTKPSQQQTATKRSQSSLLSGAVRRKGSEDSAPSKKQRTSSPESAESPDIKKPGNSSVVKSDEQDKNNVETDPIGSSGGSNTSSSRTDNVNKVAKVVAVLPSVLPGMQQYDDSTDSQSSSSDSEPDFALAGKSCVYMKVQQ